MTPPASAFRPALAAAILSAVLLAGCGPDSKPVTSAAAATAQPASGTALTDPCNEPAGMNLPEPPPPVNQVDFVPSTKAQRARKSGCAGVRFSITADGGVADPVVVVEQPPGYGFGDAIVAGLSKTRFDPKTAKPGQYYSNSAIAQSASGDAPAARPSVY